MRQSIHVKIDMDDYITGKSKGVVWSDLIRGLIKQYFELENVKIPEEAELERQLKIAQEEKKRSVELVEEVSAKLFHLREKKEKERQDTIDKSLRMNEALRTSRVMNFD